MKVIFANIDKKSIKTFDDNVKYVLITEEKDQLDLYSDFKIKPIIILYNGSYVVDLENNNVIIKRPIGNTSFNKIISYGKTHEVKTKVYQKDNNVYEIKITTDNYHRRLIIPYMFRDLFPDVKSVTIGKNIYINSNDVSLINAIDEVLNYLNVTNNFIDLENIYINVSSDGYYRDKINWKGIEIL